MKRHSFFYIIYGMVLSEWVSEWEKSQPNIKVHRKHDFFSLQSVLHSAVTLFLCTSEKKRKKCKSGTGKRALSAPRMNSSLLLSSSSSSSSMVVHAHLSLSFIYLYIYIFIYINNLVFFQAQQQQRQQQARTVRPQMMLRTCNRDIHRICGTTSINICSVKKEYSLCYAICSMLSTKKKLFLKNFLTQKVCLNTILNRHHQYQWFHKYFKLKKRLKISWKKEFLMSIMLTFLLT